MSKQKLKHFNQPAFNTDLEKATEMISISKEVKEGLEKFNCETLDEVKEHLHKKTGFDNYMLAADSFNLKNEYTTIAIYFDRIDFSHYNEDCSELTPKFQKNLRENHSIYWSAEDTETIDKVCDVLSKLNVFKVGASVALNRDGDLYFNERNWDITRQLNNASGKRR